MANTRFIFQVLHVIAWIFFVGLCIEAIKDLKSHNEILNTELSDLKTELSDLKTELTDLKVQLQM